MFIFLEYLMGLDKEIFIMYSLYFLLGMIVASVMIELIIKETYKFILYSLKKIFGKVKKVS